MKKIVHIENLTYVEHGGSGCLGVREVSVEELDAWLSKQSGSPTTMLCPKDRKLLEELWKKEKNNVFTISGFGGHTVRINFFNLGQE